MYQALNIQAKEIGNRLKKKNCLAFCMPHGHETDFFWTEKFQYTIKSANL